MKFLIPLGIALVSLVIALALVQTKKPDTSLDVVYANPTDSPMRRHWVAPFCPREITMQDGTRWAPPSWSLPGCRIVLIWDAK